MPLYCHLHSFVDSTQYGCSIGDKFHDNRFWRVNEDGTETEVPYILTAEEEVQILKTENNEFISNTTSILCRIYGKGIFSIGSAGNIICHFVIVTDHDILYSSF